METEKTLSPEQIINWRKIIARQLITKAEQMGIDPEGITIWAHIMPDSEVIAYWKRMKAFLSTPEISESKPVRKPMSEGWKQVNGKFKKVCDHSNSIKGSKGRYCLDCEMYV